MEEILVPHGTHSAFLTLHEILEDAKKEAFFSKDFHNKKTTLRLPRDLKEKTDFILHANGTSLSRFFKKCCERLVHEYTNPVELR